MATLSHGIAEVSKAHSRIARGVSARQQQAVRAPRSGKESLAARGAADLRSYLAWGAQESLRRDRLLLHGICV